MATTRLNAGLAEHLRREDTEGVAGCYYELGRVAANRGAHADARDWLEQSAAAYRDADLLPELSHCLIYLGDERAILGEFGPARRTLTEAITLCQRAALHPGAPKAAGGSHVPPAGLHAQHCGAHRVFR